METFLGIDYPTWWYLVLGAVLTGYAMLDGFDLGAGALHLFLKDSDDRRIALNAIGPVWDGNEVWLVIGGGALFAGFPEVYATVFSAFYIPFMLFLVSLIFRGISIEFRGKEPMAWWRKMWDINYSISSVLLALLLGIVAGNLLQGIAVSEDREYYGSWLAFINPYAIMVGITTLALFMMHGGIYLSMKTQDRLFDQLRLFVRNSTVFFVVSFAVTTMYSLVFFPHLSEKFKEQPILFALPVIVMLSIANTARLQHEGKYKLAFAFSSFTIAFSLMLVALNLYPNLVISTLNPDYSLNVYNSAASQKSLGIMLTIAAIGAPLAAFYTIFVFWTFKGKVTIDEHSY